MKIKRDPESMREVRAILARSPGWYPKAELDAMSDDELADALERSFTGLEQALPKLRSAMEDAAKRIAQALRPLADPLDRHPFGDEAVALRRARRQVRKGKVRWLPET